MANKAQQTVTIKFQPQGERPLINAIKALDRASKSLTSTQGRLAKETTRTARTQTHYSKETKKAEQRTRILGGTLAVARSKLLLFNFAMGLGVRQVLKFSMQGAKIESMGRAFDTLSGGAEESSVAFEKLREATDGTMSQFDLFQQANNAMILGVSKNSDEMAEMFDIAQRLGRALGRDTASSVESLVTGIGRQSRLMLDNIGIIVKADEAYESYARKLGTTSDKLSDADKKQAFLEATMESARAKVNTLGEETLSTQDAFDKFTASASNLGAKIGDFLNPLVAGLANNFADVADAISGANQQETTREDELIEKLIFRNSLADTKNKLEENSAIIAQNTQRQSSKSSKEEEKRISARLGALDMEILRYSDLLFTYKEINEIKKVTNDMMIQEVETVDRVLPKALSLADTYKLLDSNQLAVVKGTEVLSNAFAQATIHGQNFGDAVVNSLKSIASQIIAKGAIFSLLSMFGVAPATSFLKFAFAHTGGYIRDDKTIQRFATGGVVQGEDNVPIMAQAGEFVMSRNAVQSIGVDNLAQMNQTGNAGVTVNIQGNMIGNEEFVRDTLIPEINRTVNQGLA